MQITLRGLSPELERHIRALAESEGISLNKAALRLLHQAAGLAPVAQTKTVIGADLDHLAGVWTPADAEAFLDSIRPCEQVDEALWK